MSGAALAAGDMEGVAPLTLHGLDLSYFTGKVQAYLRYRNVPHRFVELSARGFSDLARRTGIAQMPAIQLADGRWMTDSSAMIAWLDPRLPGRRVIPEDPVQRFLCLLVEDYADEWLWRPALHYRWSHAADAHLMSRRIAAEMLHDLPVPLFLRRWFVLARQVRRYVHHDGVTRATRAHVEDVYRRNLGFLEAILRERDFLLGDAPSLADFGFFASMFRHFGIDPTPARLMRDSAPAVNAWLGRLWNANQDGMEGAGSWAAPGTVPSTWAPLLRDIGASYLPYLRANAQAWSRGARHFRFETEGVTYHLPVNRYRVHCLEALTRAHGALTAAEASVVATLAPALADPACWGAPGRPSGYDPDQRAPFLVPGRVWA